MSPRLRDDASWRLALTLAERARLASRPAAGAVDREAARTRLEAWRKQPPFGDPGLWVRRLAAAGLAEPDLCALLGESAASLGERASTVPAWLAQLEEAFAQPAGDGDLPASLRSADPAGFLALLAPLIRDGCVALRSAVERIAETAPAGLLFDPSRAVELLAPSLALALQTEIVRTLALELNVARLEGTIAGATPDERFRSFAERLRRPETALEILGRFPVLARQAGERIGQWVEAGTELLARLAADGPALCDVFGLAAGDLLTEARGGAGDRHRGGRSVTLLRFSSGRGLVYKPKPLAVEAAFQEVAAWANRRGFQPALRTLRVLDRGEYGWAERVVPAECAEEAGVRRFYERQGGLLALFFALDAADVHGENLLASGEHPVPVDLEALFHPWLADRETEERGAALPLGADVTARTVLRVGLLPERMGAGRDHPGVDLSGLGAAPGQTTPRPVLAVADEGTDRMRFDRRRMPVPAPDNRPLLTGRAEVRLSAYIGSVVAGFERMLRLVLEHRDDLLAAGGPLDAFAGAEVRVILRPTQGYHNLLTESFHPDVLGDALRRDRLFDRLWAGVPHRPFLERLIPAEQADLERGDIPLFVTRADSADLWTSRGERLPGFFDSSGLERVRGSLARLTEADLVLQAAQIRGALTAVALTERALRLPPYRLTEAPEPAGRDALLAAASAAGDRLAALAYRDRDAVHWFGLAPAGDGSWAFGPVQADLYDGLPGIALFLAHLGEVTGDRRFTELARATAAPLRALPRRKPMPLRLLGGYTGWGGIVYTLVSLGALWGDGDLLDDAAACVEPMRELAPRDEPLDLLDGAAGAILPLLRLHALRPAAGALDVALACGERVLAQAAAQERGIGWQIPGAGPAPLTGLSHGAAGIALALLRLAAASGDERFRAAARAGFEFERGIYSPALRNWPDLRPEEDRRVAHLPGEKTMCAWCHGATGIGLSRLAARSVSDDPALDEEIAIAVETTLAEGFGYNHSLCHGDLGCLDFLLLAARQGSDADLERRVYRLAGGVLESIAALGWRYGMPEGAEPPGLMVGLAGIGYGLLRLAAPDRVPCVLLLD